MNKHPNQGGCWYCHDDEGEMLFSVEFDCYIHEKCLRNALKDEKDREAQIMGRELNNPYHLFYPRE